MDAGKIHVPLGLALLKNGNFPEAAVEFSRALDHDQANDYLLFLRGMTFMNMGSSEEAVDDLNTSIRINGMRGFAYVARSLAFRELHWDVESENDLKSALALADVEVELFIREFCITPALQRLALSLFDVGKEAWGKELWERHSSQATH
jgi:tetratricopeptide (TPR) repeat protein